MPLSGSGGETGSLPRRAGSVLLHGALLRGGRDDIVVGYAYASGDESLGTAMNDNRDRTYLQTPAQWTRFLSAFAHEIRTPLASFRVLTDLLAEAPPGHLGDQQRRYTENLREVAQDIQTLVGEVAELAQLLAGRAVVKPGEVALEQLVDQVEAAVRPRAWEGGIALTGSRDPALPRLFRTDPDHLRQVLSLLLGAAISHARSEVFFRLDLAGRDLRIVISSDGLPFEETALRSLFEPFHDGVRSGRPRGGRSLALPLANELAWTLGGALGAENRGGRPTFDLSVPAAGS
jgi:signal transduction histidine kinase